MTDLQQNFSLFGLMVIGVIFCVGVTTMLIRRMAVWNLVGQIMALKAVAAASFLLAVSSKNSAGDLFVLSLVVLGIIPIATAVGLLVIHRCTRFNGSLDVEEEDALRN